MKKELITVIATLCSLSMYAANDVLRIVHGGITDYVPLSDIDSIYFDENGTTMLIQPIEKVTPVSIARTDIQTMEYVSADVCPSKISIVYNGNSVTAENPFLLSGVSIAADGAYVTVKNSNISTEYTTDLSGSTTNGGFTYEGEYKTTIVLNGVSITSQRGAAIDIECGKRVALELKKGTVNTLVDAAGGKQKAALYCKGHLEIDKTGTLNVTGNTAHAISAKEYIQLKKSTGTINILAAKNDGIHCKQYFSAKGFTVNISGIEGDGIQAEVEELDEDETYGEDYENGSIQIMDGTFTITSTNDGGVKTSETTETVKSYKVYVAKTVGTSGGWGGNRGGNYWNNIYLYKADGTFVSQLTSTVTLTGTNGQSLQFYVYDFKQSDAGTYYFKSDNYSGNGGTSYTIVSSQFTGPQSGIDYYYQISNSYTTSGSTRTFQLSSVQEIYGGGSKENVDTYYSVCLKADKAVSISGGTFVLTNSGTMSKSVKAGNSEYDGTVTISGGDITCNASGDMYLSGTNATYCAAIKTDNYYGTGGTLTINASTGKAVRGISADKVINISDGTYNITNSSNGHLGSNDTYTAKGLTCDKNIVISGGTLNIKASGTGGKCIKADGEITIGAEDGSGPIITASTTGSGLGTSSGGGPGGGWGGQQTSVSSSSKAIKAIGQVIVNGGNLTVTTATNGAEGMESKTSVLIKGGNHYFKCYDDCINSAGIINFAGGNTVCYATNNDAVDSNYGRSGAITISGGNVFAYTTAGSPEEGLDCDNNSYITITGGIAISAGGSQGGGGGWGGSSSSNVGSATQGYFLGSSPSSYNTTNYYTLCNTSGEAICTYKFEGNVSNSLSLLTAPNLGKGSITVKQGTTEPESYASAVNNASGKGVLFISPKVTTTSNAATLTAK
ncbi:MAG: carbohydrate-binding domain-containing protein [Prevotella sp.]|nr:carbohydrate-binding domain-containing protein [Prevotella sp.]